MAQKLGILDQWLFGNWADRAAINRNAEDLSVVESDLSTLRNIVERQSREMLQLRAMFMGVLEVLQSKVQIDDVELDSAIKAAWAKLAPPPPQQPTATDPYRGTPIDSTPKDSEAAKALLDTAWKHHRGKEFREARAIYQQIVDQHGDSKQATIARQQLANLRNA